MRFQRRETVGAMTELNVTPLMDLAFSLLIIFMISTPLLEQTIPVDLPQQERSASSRRPEIEFQVISIDSNGHIFWGKQQVDLPELDRLLGNLATLADPPAISLRGDRSLPYQKIIDVIDAIKRHNLTKMHLDTSVK